VSDEISVEDTTPPDRRPQRRRRMLLSGIVVFGESVFDCAIRNLSETGAKISCAKGVSLPSSFHLIIVRDRVAYDARPIWNTGKECGVAFTARIPLGEISDPMLSHLPRLWLSRAGQ